jgi:molecular chaperone DnaK
LYEPIAAALCYTNGDTEKKAIGIYDLGGGTFDASIVVIKDNLYQVNSIIK